MIVRAGREKLDRDISERVKSLLEERGWRGEKPSARTETEQTNGDAAKTEVSLLPNSRCPTECLQSCLRNVDYLGELLSSYRDKLKQLAENPYATIKYCDFLQRRIYVQYNGEVALCCVLGSTGIGEHKRQYHI